MWHQILFFSHTNDILFHVFTFANIVKKKTLKGSILGKKLEVHLYRIERKEGNIRDKKGLAEVTGNGINRK